MSEAKLLRCSADSQYEPKRVYARETEDGPEVVVYQGVTSLHVSVIWHFLKHHPEARKAAVREILARQKLGLEKADA